MTKQEKSKDIWGEEEVPQGEQGADELDPRPAPE